MDMDKLLMFSFRKMTTYLNNENIEKKKMHTDKNLKWGNGN